MNFRINWDAMGIATSLVCAIHCAVLPLVLTSLPVFGVNLVENMPFEYGMVALAGAIGIYSLSHGYRKHHRSLLPLGLFLTGMCFLLAKQLWHHYEFMLLPVAVVLIIAAHWVNYRLCKVQSHVHTNECDH